MNFIEKPVQKKKVKFEEKQSEESMDEDKNERDQTDDSISGADKFK